MSESIRQFLVILAGLGSIGSFGALIFICIQVMQTRKILKSTSYQNLVSINNELNRMFFERPKIWQNLFPKGYCGLEGDTQMIVSGIQILDLFDSILVREKTIINFPAWENFIQDVFKHSPFLINLATKLESHYTPKLLKYTI